VCRLTGHFSTDPCKPLNALRGTADSETVDSRVRLLKQLVEESMYVVDERAVADAIVARALVREAVAAPRRRVRRRGSRVRSAHGKPRAGRSDQLFPLT
jgi:hypothetical protein